MPKSKTQFSDALRKQRNPKPKPKKAKPRKVQNLGGTRPLTSPGIPRPAKVLRVDNPRFSQNKRGNFRIAHREFIGTLYSLNTQNWTVFNFVNVVGGPSVPARFRCNPASEGTFPFLNPIGKCFERFKFNKLKFILLPKANFNRNGDNLITPDYDAEDGAPFSETIASNNINTVSGPLMQEIVCDLPASKLNKAYKSHYCMGDIRFANTNQDTKTIDPAQVIFSGENDTYSAVSAPFAFAKVWVEYDVEFDTPQSATEAANQGGYFSSQSTSGSGFAAPSSTASQPNPLVTPISNTANTNLYQFNRDWVGNLSSVFTSTGALNPASYVPLKNGNPFPAANSGPGSFTYGPQIGTAVGAGGGYSTRVDPVSFKTGDILSYTATLPSVATAVNTILGGSSAGYIPTLL